MATRWQPSISFNNQCDQYHNGQPRRITAERLLSVSNMNMKEAGLPLIDSVKIEITPSMIFKFRNLLPPHLQIIFPFQNWLKRQSDIWRDGNKINAIGRNDG